MLFLVITCLLYLQILKEDNGECSCKGRKTSFPLSFPFFLYGLRFSLKGQKNWLFTFGRCFSLCSVSYLSRGVLLLPWGFTLTSMGTTMKGIYKGFKCISNIFVVKEREMEMEIGFPTDVKHVAHIGWDGPSGNAPSWMNEFKTGPDFAATSIGNSGSALSPWASQDFGESMRQHSTSELYKDAAPKELRTNPKKQKRRKAKSTSSPKSNSSSSSRSSRAAKPKTKFVEDNGKPADIEVA